MEKKYKLSVIIPIYNVEKYLEETLKSVIEQTLGFENNIEMILVNDGSPDNSEDICLRYKEKYPENIVYIKQKNGGVSSARNTGAKVAKGKYINFLDSDDILSKNAYKRAVELLDQNKDVNIATLRIKFFDARKGYHNLDYKFSKGTRIVELEKEPNNPIYHVTTSVLRNSEAKKYQFDTNIAISEDMKYLASYLFNNRKVIIVADELYYYRKRKEDDSAIQTSKTKKTYYINTLKYCYEYVLELMKKSKELNHFYQYFLSYDLYWRIFGVNLSVLDDKEKKEYIEEMRKLYSECDDSIILDRHIETPLGLSRNMRTIEFKYGKSIVNDIKLKNNDLYFKDKLLVTNKQLALEVYYLNIHQNSLIINVNFNLFLNCEWDIYLRDNNKEYHKMKKSKFNDSKNLFSYDNEYYTNFYEAKIDLKNIRTLEFFIKIDNNYVKITPFFNRYSRLNNLKNCYFKKNNYTIYHENNKIIINGKKKMLFFKYMYELLFKQKEVMPFGLIMLHFITYPFTRKKNWIVSDRYDVAGDNGEWMFKYIRKHNSKKNVYFGLGKNSKDVNRMSKYGKVIYFKTIDYYLKYLNCEFVISSHIDNYIHKPYGKKQIYVNPFLDRKYVFLQHGVTKEDISGWLYKYGRYADLFICSAKMEYDSILNGCYLYDSDTVKLTGMARYDNLIKNDVKEENLIALMPTWRSTLVGSIITGTQGRNYNPKFKESEYYKFYNGLINDKRIIDSLKRNNYKILFCVHPSLKGQLEDFEGNEYVEMTVYVDYPTIFKKAKLMITDYSSVFFDFAYLKKPIIYSQFDKSYLHLIHSIHTTGKDYFDFEKMGFGPVTKNYEDTVNEIVKAIDNGCKTDKKYISRVNSFFKYFDDNNCKRIYEEILKKRE